MRRSHSPQRGLSAVAAGGSGPLKLLLATGGATERTPLMPLPGLLTGVTGVTGLTKPDGVAGLIKGDNPPVDIGLVTIGSSMLCLS